MIVTGLILFFSPVAMAGENDNRIWKPLEKDGLHDPDGPAIKELQQPNQAMTALPADVVGNQVRWVEALKNGSIKPRTNIMPDTRIQVLDLDLIYGNTGDNPFVLFPHRQHTEWLDCANCHEELFKSKFGATPIKMMDILGGQYCGRCHGAVAFPLTECKRCHSVDPDTFRGKFGSQNPQVQVQDPQGKGQGSVPGQGSSPGQGSGQGQKQGKNKK
ncbi:MAG: hypothetical protein HQL65_06685 [Magnetococcales bacterium]|nr:hypothetical protein [Magnetococcales bacterium]